MVTRALVAVAVSWSTDRPYFKVLREAGLIHSERKGVELHNHTRCAELKDRFGEMIGAIVGAYKAQQASFREFASVLTVAVVLVFFVLLATFKVTSPHTIHPGVSLPNLVAFAREHGIAFADVLTRHF